MKHAIQFTLESRNGKVGRIPVSTTSRETCPDECPLKKSGCYAEHGNLGMLWRTLSDTTAGHSYQYSGNTLWSLTWKQFCAKVAELPDGQYWRHNQAGDLPGKNNSIDVAKLRALVKANRGRNGFTYTHKPLTPRNAAAIKEANANGFTINLSADNLTEADSLAAANIGPVVVVLPSTVQGNVKITTPEGRRVVICPATYRDDVSCGGGNKKKACLLCARQRDCIVGFPAHGAARRMASTIALGKETA